MKLLSSTILGSPNLGDTSVEETPLVKSLDMPAGRVSSLNITMKHIVPFIKEILPILKSSEHYAPYTPEILKALMIFEFGIVKYYCDDFALNIIKSSGKHVQYFREKHAEPRKRKMTNNVSCEYPVYLQYDREKKGYLCDKCSFIGQSLPRLNLHFYFEHAKNQVGDISEKTKKMKLDHDQPSEQSTDQGTNNAAEMEDGWLLV
ncbi:C2H2-type domain-containing protein [Caenorhabditis elegans]|uniref:C2H2-type domain-containing protein n=1 Tax=Caenorhabditis elegans TaxID=6239 RepID=O62369_CAEEL|nr:C2H2-type domain-containing protein [Caenorhabditis elegans]CAB04703.1 C2H2-type domain-containing protein [Caenorhabditis elegans]|eukprot:NP_493224.1 Uncharacterized protein CELE_T06G6.5 [Caenorhabditis elegans]